MYETTGVESDEQEPCAAWGCTGIWAKSISRVIPLCLYHFAYSHSAYETSLADRAAAVEAANLDPSRASRRVTRMVGDFRPVVYYAAMMDKVKIGTTSDLPRRMQELYVQRDDLLAVEPGGRNLERSRHQQFAPYRVKGTELFRRNGVLDDLITNLRAMRSDPWLAARGINAPHFVEEWASEEVIRGREVLGIN